MYDGLRRTPIHKARDIGKQYPSGVPVVTRYFSLVFPSFARVLSRSILLSVAQFVPTSSTFRWGNPTLGPGPAETDSRRTNTRPSRESCLRFTSVSRGFVCRPFFVRAYVASEVFSLVNDRRLGTVNSRMDLARTRGNSCRAVL